MPRVLTEKRVAEMIFDVVKASITAMEERITKQLMREADAIMPPLLITMSKATPMKPAMFGHLPGGSVFRLEAGTQPIMKLQKDHGWGMPMRDRANCFYLLTGSTTHLSDDKRIVPLKSTITIDE